MRNLLLAVALPLAVLGAAFLPLFLRDDAVGPGQEEHARRLVGQAGVMSDLRFGTAVVRSMTVTDPANFDTVQGSVEWLGPFGITVLEVEVGHETQDAAPYPGQAAAAWGGLLVATIAGPAFVIWRETRA